ncbi:uncharacterized protein LOC111905444 isoform X1 [Lactuca sativa]|uniref:Uncharacterized protein n=1 Tax=Lactuca sativa TaxID=4236 RepID=A0A9R1UZC0_LACSA|nr:uncharacterized protein LOC111905444 isoform X1 [Lactuca sativa]KAJ0195461.1 hypothetical protein LSAT_V11C700357070 [Lactuca sativa]
MASSGKFDLSSSSSPSRPLFTSGKRGSHTAPSMERSTSFRENIENPILSSLPSMSRSTVNVSQGEVTNFFQCLRFDLKSMAAEYKCNRFGDFKRLASAALCAPDDSPSGLLKGKFPSSSPENIKRLKVGLRESTIKARERVKIFSDVLSVMNKCFPSIPSRKRSRPDAFSVGKMGTTSGFEYEQQKVEERGKNVVPNKRTRTSMVDLRADVRPNTPARSSGSVDREREVLRLPNSNVLQGEERVIPVVADGWEKAKMKKKRTGMKADATLSASSVSAKPIDGIRDSRVHPRSLLDARSRLNDSHGFRPGAVNVREDFISGSSSSTPRLHATARGPRSGTGGIPKLPHGQRATVSNGMESQSQSQSPHGTSKNPSAMGPTNRKRTLSTPTQSSSPPVAQWAERRPQKISRTARRMNLVPVVSNDDVSTLGNSDATVGEKRRGFAKRFPKQFKSKVDHTLSESEESGAAEVSEEKGGSSVQKMSNLVLSTRKNKFMTGFASARSIGTAKQLKSGRVGVDKPESKIGRPPTRKLSGRKAYMRQKHSSITTPTDFLVTSDDGNGELLAAANAVINPNPGFVSSSPFWSQMDRLFGFVYDADVAYIKQEGSIQSTVNTANSIDYCDTHSNGSFEPPKTETECSSESSEHVMSGTSLCQRLLAALISEEDDNDYTWHGNDVYESAFEPETDGSFLSSYRMDSPLRDTGFDDCYKGLLVSEPTVVTCSQYQYGNMSMDERLLMEIHSLGLYPSPVPDLVQTGDEDVSIDIRRLEEKHHQQVSRKKTLLNKLLKSTEEARVLHEKEFEQLSLEKLTRIAYHKYMNSWGPNAPGGKGVNGKMAKQLALECVKRTLDRCHEFETTGKSCFSEPLFMDMFLSGLSHFNDNTNTQQSPSLTNFDSYPPDTQNHSSDQGKEDDVWPIRSKKRELYLDDVAGTSISSGKGKRSDREREREGKGNGIRNGGPKIGRPTVSGNGERKSKAKIKQKTSQVSSVPIPVPIPIPIPKVEEKEKNECMLLLEDPLDLSHLQLPEFDVDVGQGQDIGSWLNIGDEVLQDDDFLGLEIPMDDLTDLNMMV